ncbi:hypothetical protein [Parerythrobacter jejuensis]|uniref:DoxX family protein n=1 Tax=Parerythrobacter jejuensis TaxID=795812 RepID=A0A845ALM8_9SPHN|nr:hypothetical protein [Parerythrobacter jejuensis]MXP31682.1 hypothetical protein [Parerythrobacter jejuensis]
MKSAYFGILGLLVLLSLAAGVAKVLQAPQEVQFFIDAGWGQGLLLPFGLVQIAGGVLALLGRSRRIGAILMALGFFLSAVAIFLTGNTVFAFLSLIPVALAVLFIRRPHFES